jgi:[protein-PII] uridylyltransferase
MSDASELRRRFDALARAYPSGQHGRWAARERADALDAWFAAALGDLPEVAIAALGGFGRRLQLPASDIDVLLIHDGLDDAALEELGGRLWYPLWDRGFSVTPLVRTPPECAEAATQRIDSCTAMLDARPVAGTEALFHRAIDPVIASVQEDPARFAGLLVRERAARGERAGSCAYDLAPDLKEGLGGLRDLASLGWLERAVGGSLVTTRVMRAADVGAIDEAEEFLVRARSAVHLETGKRVDRLSTELQPDVAASMGFVDEPALPAIDGLMRSVFERARLVDVVTRTALARVHGDAHGMPDIRISGPASVLEAIATVDQQLAPDLLDAIADGDVPDPVVWDAAVTNAFLEMLRRRDGGASALDALDRVGLLERYVPPWRDVRSRPQRDPYHRFTVDGHLTMTLATMAELLDDPATDPLATEVAGLVTDPDALRLGALLHDIGKVGTGDHVPAGAAIAREQLDRMHLEPHTADLAAFMVAEHLLLPDTATRRDLTDENLIMDVAATVSTTERLAALSLLAVADAAATGPAAWTPWRRALVTELVTKVRHVLERGAMGAELAATLAERVEAVRELLEQEPERDVDAFVLRMPRGYFLSLAPRDAARHFRTISPHLGSDELRTASTDGARPGTYELLVVTPDRAGLLSSVAGALALGGISILSAQVFTTSDHVAVDLFEVAGVFEPEVTEERWRGVRSTLRRVIEGATSLDRRIEDMRRHYPAPAVHTPVTVRVDNDTSDFATVFEVGAPDRMGLLFDITRALAAVGLDVHLAKVATFNGRVVDAFYVRDELGRKITDPAALERLTAALTGTLTDRLAR